MKRPSYPSPNPTFCPIKGVSVNIGLGERRAGRFQQSQAGVDFVNSLHPNGNQRQASPPYIPGKSNICFPCLLLACYLVVLLNLEVIIIELCFTAESLEMPG